jgi:hypothetical protein
MSTPLMITPLSRYGTKGQVYEITLDGEVLASGPSPEFAACRVLKDRGYSGTVEFWRAGRPTYDMRMSVEWGAKRTITETARTGPRFAKWAPNPLFGHAAQ